MFKLFKEERKYWIDILENTNNRLLNRVAADNLYKINKLWNKWIRRKRKVNE